MRFSSEKVVKKMKWNEESRTLDELTVEPDTRTFPGFLGLRLLNSNQIKVLIRDRDLTGGKPDLKSSKRFEGLLLT